MELYNLLFGCKPENTDEMFYNGNAELDADKHLNIKSNNTVSFETYFNLFSYAKYRKYCNIQKFRVRLYGKGNFRADFYCRTKKKSAQHIDTVEFTDTLDFDLDISALPEIGYVYFTLTALNDAILFSGKYGADIKTPNVVKIGLVICTYKRETFVTDNLNRLLAGISKEPIWGERLHVYVIDNAKTLNLPQSPFYTVVPNPNLGGSGGFTRGITEVCKDSSFTHFLLMDDDIHFEFETLKRTFHLLEALDSEYKNSTVGGAMLYLDKPTVQHEFGGYFTGMKYQAVNSRLDMSVTENLIANEGDSKANYNAWWYTCMPVETVQKYGLPLPLFIKGDDVEYGIRCIENLILMSGIAVWHQDFTLKYNGTLEYYTKRNELVVAAIHSRLSKWKQGMKLLYSVFVQLTLKRYYCAELILKAYQDFLQGPQFFMNSNMEALNAQIMNAYPQNYSKTHLEQKFNINIDESLSKNATVKKKRRSLIRKMILTAENYLPSFLFKKKPIVVDANSTRAKPLFLKKVSIHYDINREQGYICELDIKRRKNLRRSAFKTLRRFLKHYKKTCNVFAIDYEKTCSTQEWNKRFYE